VAYQLAHRTNLKFHNVFYVSLLKNHVHNPTHMIDYTLMHMEPEGDFQEEPLCILDLREKVHWNKSRHPGKSEMGAL
jgi:hypothetical protein